jgi:hypothetical protein
LLSHFTLLRFSVADYSLLSSSNANNPHNNILGPEMLKRGPSTLTLYATTLKFSSFVS